MKINGDKLTKLAEARGVTPEQLAASIERTGLAGAKAVSAVKNWMRNSDHPRCKAADIAKLAQALGVAGKDIARFTCILRNHRGSTRKTKLVVDLIRGKTVDQAITMLSFTPKRAAVDVKKALLAAMNEAQRYDADYGSLIVAESRADNAVRMKRFQPKDRGRAHSIIKEFTHITVGVEERAKTGR